MSFTLTNRDTTVLTLTAVSALPDGVSYACDLSSISDGYFGKCRFTNVNGKSGVGRANFHLERLKRNAATGKLERVAVDITVALDNGSAYLQDDVDDLITWATSYFNSESNSANFVTGLPRT